MCHCVSPRVARVACLSLTVWLWAPFDCVSLGVGRELRVTISRRIENQKTFTGARSRARVSVTVWCVDRAGPPGPRGRGRGDGGVYMKCVR